MLGEWEKDERRFASLPRTKTSRVARIRQPASGGGACSDRDLVGKTATNC